MNLKPAIEMKNISKSFGDLKANDNVDLEVYRGEVHAILGENGAGKSTLMNMLSGIYKQDSGTIAIDGEEVELKSPKDAIAKGIGMIHQHFKLVEVMSAVENVSLGQDGGIFRNKKKALEDLEALCEKYGLEVNGNRKVYEMSVGEKQTLEIIKVLHKGAEILILDEPTAVLTPQEIEKLFDIIRNMKERGCAIIIITHKLNEVMEISDKITVLRKGQSISTVKTREVDVSDLIDMMVGKKMALSIERVKTEEVGEPLLELRNVDVMGEDKKPALKNASFVLNSGEILGVAGVAGSGQKELCEAIAGLLKLEKGDILFENESLKGKKTREILKKGISIGFIPEDRLGMGLVGNMNIVQNLLLKEYRNQKGLFLKTADVTKKAERIVEELEVKTSSIYAPVQKMSGGNIQKVLLGREIDLDPKVILTAYPVRGLDIGASHKIYDLLNEQKKKGVGVLFIGEDLDVLLEISDRIMVMCGGEITGIVNAENVDKEELGMLMTGTVLETEEVGFNELA